MLAGVLALAIAPCACTASGHPGGHAIRQGRPSATSPQHRRSGSPSVQLVVEASGDLLIHAAVFDRARVLGGGRHYDFAPMFAQIKPYIQGADLALCHVETPMTSAPATGYPTFNTPPERTPWTRGRPESTTRSARWIAPGWHTPAPSPRRPRGQRR
jgi:poly-gamma-glutamate synthesis protein (capsule biosynthesis protein)